ncbi:MAG: hypothetical protein JXA04_04085 [Gammaproteobacteria bacterium]|nr:hypothetical protein [Gammaproteobacteria bacterium]
MSHTYKFTGVDGEQVVGLERLPWIRVCVAAPAHPVPATLSRSCAASLHPDCSKKTASSQDIRLLLAILANRISKDLIKITHIRRDAAVKHHHFKTPGWISKIKKAIVLYHQPDIYP